MSKRNLSHSEVHTLADLIGYNDGAVVSRTLVKNEAGTVTVFAFDVDQGLSEHTAPYDALVQVIDGSGDFTIEGTKNTLTAGQLILLPAKIPHSVNAVTPMKMLLTMIRAKE